MKKLFLAIIVLFSSLLASAQVWIGGATHAQLNSESQSFSLAPDIGYCFPNTPFSVACALEYRGIFQQNQDPDNELTITPYFRYDFGTLEERFSFFIDLAADFEILKGDYFNLGVAPGVSFMLTEHWSAEFSYGFLGFEHDKDGDLTHKNFLLDFSASAASIGIYYNF